MRGRQMLIPYLLLVAALAGILLLWQARQGSNFGGEVPVLGKVVSTGTVAVGGPFTLTDQNGRRVASSDDSRNSSRRMSSSDAVRARRRSLMPSAASNSPTDSSDCASS